MPPRLCGRRLGASFNDYKASRASGLCRDLEPPAFEEIGSGIDLQDDKSGSPTSQRLFGRPKAFLSVRDFDADEMSGVKEGVESPCSESASFAIGRNPEGERLAFSDKQ